jgi:hypothetical protein
MATARKKPRKTETTISQGARVPERGIALAQRVPLTLPLQVEFSK